MQPLDQLIENLTSGDDHRAEASARSFPDYGEAGLNALVDLYQQPDADLRWWAVRAMAAFDVIKYPQASKVLVSALGDSDLNVMACAAVGLRERPVVEAIPELIKKLAHEDKLIARLAGDALAALEKSASPALVEFLGQEEALPHAARVEAVRALAKIGDPAAIGPLFEVWENGSSMMQYWAERGLHDLGIGMAFFDPGA